MLHYEPHLADLMLFRGILPALRQQNINYRPFVGMEVEFSDCISIVHEIFHGSLADVAVVPIERGVRVLVYNFPAQ